MLRWLAALALCASMIVAPARADLSSLVTACASDGNQLEAMIACTTITADNVGSQATLATAHARLGLLQTFFGEYSSALDAYRTGRKRWPADARFPSGLADVFNRQKKHDLAISAAKAAIRLDPAASAAYHQRGRAYLATGEALKALADFKTAFEANRDDIMLAADIGFALSDLGRKEEAATYYARALATEDVGNEGTIMRGKVHLRMGRPDLAVAECGRMRPEFHWYTENCPAILSAAAEMSARSPSATERAALETSPPPDSVVTPAPPSPDKVAIAPAPLRRLALVIGNSAYENVSSLRNPGPDANAIAGKLREKGFEVTHEQDVGRRKLISTINAFLNAITTKSQVVVYYAGHGVELDGANYIVPTDVPALSPEAEALIKDNSVNLSSLLVEIGRRKATATVVILDACRDNPFRGVKVAGLSRSLRASDGLAPVAAPNGVYVMFSAGVNQAALDRLSYDDPDPNGLFTRRLLRLMDVKGLELRTMATRLRSEVGELAKTSKITNPDGHEQSPAAYDQMTGEFYFTPADEG